MSSRMNTDCPDASPARELIPEPVQQHGQFDDAFDQIPPSPFMLIASIPQYSGASDSDADGIRVRLPQPTDTPVPSFIRGTPVRDADQQDQPGSTSRCPHDLVYPCFCRNTTEEPGRACLACRFPPCEVSRMLVIGSIEQLEQQLQAEEARGRGATQFEGALRDALDRARQHRVRAEAELRRRNNHLRRVAAASLAELDRRADAAGQAGAEAWTESADDADDELSD
ncbi:hypothetical protein EsH8_I_001336 [Colletotrichum jinshuiense]